MYSYNDMCQVEEYQIFRQDFMGGGNDFFYFKSV